MFVMVHRGDKKYNGESCTSGGECYTGNCIPFYCTGTAKVCMTAKPGCRGPCTPKNGTCGDFLDCCTGNGLDLTCLNNRCVNRPPLEQTNGGPGALCRNDADCKNNACDDDNSGTGSKECNRDEN